MSRPLTLCLCALLHPACATAPPLVQIERLVVAMGAPLRLQLGARDRGTALQASETALRQVEAAEAVWSSWRQDSEVSRLHRTPAGTPFAASEELRSGLQAAAVWAERTDGAFDPCLGALVDAYAQGRGGRWPPSEEVAGALVACGPDALRFSAGAVVRQHPGVRVAEGGFAKGLALDGAARAALEAGAREVLLDFGGQVLVVGVASTSIGVADPRDRGRVALHLDIDGGSVATTGNSEHGLLVEGRRLGHVLDPRTGAPATDFGSVTVWAGDALAADCLSTALFVLGPERAIDWARRHPGIEVLVLRATERRLEATCTDGLRGRVRAAFPDLDLVAAPHSTHR